MYNELFVLCDEHGLFLRRDALARGYRDRDLYRAMRERIIHRVRHGAYVLCDQWNPLSAAEQHRLCAFAVLRTSRTRLVLSHTTAVVLHGAPTWDLPLDNVHGTRTDRRGGRKEAGVVQHRGLLLPADIAEVNGRELTTPTRTALDLTTIANVEHCLPVFDHFLRTGETTKKSLRDGSRAMKLWKETLSTDLVISLADGRRESVGESRTGYLLWRGGVPAPVPQYEILDDSGHVFARVDFAWPELGVFLEFDGKEKYLKFRKPEETIIDCVRREKKREERICRLTGWRCIRITWADLYQPEQTAAYIMSVLLGGPVHA